MHTFDMRRTQSAWKGLSTMEPGSAYGIIDPNFMRRRPRPEEVLIARNQERFLRKLAGVKRLVPLSQVPEEATASKRGNRAEGEVGVAVSAVDATRDAAALVPVKLGIRIIKIICMGGLSYVYHDVY